MRGLGRWTLTGLKWPTTGLLRHADHVVDGLLDQVVRRVGATALRGHHTRGAGEAVDDVVVQRVFALRYAGAPGSLVASLWRTRDTGAMAGAASLLEEVY